MRITLIILSLICLALGRANAQSDLSLVLDKEGKIVAIPKPKPFELDIQDVSELDYTPKLAMAELPARGIHDTPGTSDGHERSLRCLSSLL